MRNPRAVFSEDGYDQYRAHLRNLAEALFFLRNHADDLALEALGGGTFYDVVLALDTEIEQHRDTLRGDSGEFLPED